MVSPFAPFANFQATFQVASGGLTPDSKGNLRPGKATIAVTALMEQKRDPRKEPRPGVDSTAIYLKGYLIDPAPLPSLITEESKCSCTWNGIQGEFFLEFVGRDPYLKALNITLVDEIKGYFQPKNFVVEGDPYVPPPPAPTPGQSATALYSPEYTASSALSALRVVKLNSSGQIAYASSDDAADAFTVLGILPSAVGSGEAIAALTEGALIDSSWAWTAGAPIWLGTGGQLTQTAPETGFLLQVAIATTPTQIEFEIQEPILL